MTFNFEIKKIVLPDTIEVIPDTLELVNTFKRSGSTPTGEKIITHRVYKDKEGREYIEIFTEPKMQIFVSNLLRDFGATPVMSYKDENGKIIYLSLFPKERDFTVETAGEIVGWANLMLINLLFLDSDHSLEVGFNFLKAQDHNVNIFLGNVMLYDFGEAFGFEKHTFIGNLKKEITSEIEHHKDAIKSFFDTFSKKGEEKFNSYYLNVIIHLRANLEKLKKQISMEGVEGIKKFLKLSKAKNIQTVFPFLPKDYSVEDFYEDLIFKIDLIDKLLAAELI